MKDSQEAPSQKPLNLLLSVYACRPDKGSEPGVGWNMAKELAKHHRVWAITRADNRAAIEAELAQHPIANLTILYHDLPVWARWWKTETRGVHLHHYLWQIGAFFEARTLHAQVTLDLVHHVTYGRYSAPSFLSLLPIPFIFGPVGGGESAPLPFWQDFNLKNKRYELLRSLARWTGERDPFVRATVKRSQAAIVATPETSQRLERLGAPRIERICGQTGINQTELAKLQQLPPISSDRPIKFISIGRLLHWKGFHLGLRAFAQANLEHSEYWLVGDGSERLQLEALAVQLNIREKVRFFGNLPRAETLDKLGQCDTLVHPSLHDFSPTVCLEGMAAGRPVICLDIGGPATQITTATGFKVAARTPEQAVADIAIVMQKLAASPQLRTRMGIAGQQRVAELYSWNSKGDFVNQLYQDVLRAA